MKIHNVRWGHATNSSSYHSFVVVRDPSKAKDIYPADPLVYGRNGFLLTSLSAKREYMAVQIASSLKRILGSKNALLFGERLVGSKGVADQVDLTDEWAYDIDHQSAMWLPNKLPDQFLKELIAWVDQDSIAIVGGSDETSWHENMAQQVAGATMEVTPNIFNFEEESVFKKDTLGHWTVYNKETGAKVRLTFPKNSVDLEANVTRSTHPELVDLKITDRCFRRCRYCYQGSTPEGQDASIETIMESFRWMRDCGTFEVAIGGGEPTEHPRFAEILRTANWNNVTPNFSTGTLRWFRNPEITDHVKSYVGRFGYSIGNSDPGRELVEVQHLAKDTGILDKLIVHVVMGTMDRNSFRSFSYLTSTLEIPMLALGFKPVGRGTDGPEFPGYEEWFLDECPVNCGIDTALAAQLGTERMTEHYIDPRTYTSQEGNFSMAIDAVTRTAGPSSYTPLQPYEDVQDLGRIFEEGQQ